MKIMKNLLRWVVVMLQFLPNHWSFQQNLKTDVDNTNGLQLLQNACLGTFHNPEWWIYMWCYKRDISQYHPKTPSDAQVLNMIGTFSAEESSSTHHIYRGSQADCKGKDGILRKRYGEVEIKCCETGAFEQHQRHQKERDSKLKSFIASVDEKEVCSYYLTVCSMLVCPGYTSAYGSSSDVPATSAIEEDDVRPVWQRSDADYAAAHVDRQEQANALRRIKDMFYFAYQSYIKSAFPEVQ